MRAKLLAAILPLIIFMSANAQQTDFEGYGTASSAELELKQCSFDKNADAIILVNEAVSNFDDEYHLITDHHVRIKILNENGKEAANVKIPYWLKDGFE